MFGSRTQTRSQFETIATRNYMWRSADQNFFYYDKDKNERIALPEGAKLIPLTTTNSVTGSRERDHGKATARWNTIISNEFTDFKNDIVKVREIDKLDKTKNVIFEGTYSGDIKDAINGVTWARYTKNIYCLLQVESGEYEVVKLSLSGASIGSWIEFEEQCKDKKIYLVDSHYVALGEPISKKNGAVNFFAPTFVLGDIDDELNALANEKAAEVEEKLERNKYASGTSEAPVDVYTATKDSGSSFAKADDEDSSDDFTEEINLDEVPF